MKSCPACQRTYADEMLTFCLEDGSVLSASYDEHKTQQIPNPPATDSILTKISYPTAKPSNPTQPLMPTMPSPEIPYVHTEEAARNQKRVKGTDNKLWLAVGGLIILALSAVIIIMLFNANKPVVTNNTFNNQNSNRTNSNDFSNKNSNDFSNKDNNSNSGFTPVDDHASLNGENLTYYQGTSPEQCQADCARNEKCRGYTFIRQGAYNPADPPMCYLASYVKNSVYHACCISAIKR
jgi:hypothetical protein